MRVPPGEKTTRKILTRGLPRKNFQMTRIDLTKDGEEVDTSKGEALGTVKVSVQIPGEAFKLAIKAVGPSASQNLSQCNRSKPAHFTK